jgi:hypothetical protein
MRLLIYLRNNCLIKCLGENDMKSLNKNSSNLNCIKAAIVASHYPNLIRLDKKNKRLLNE